MFLIINLILNKDMFKMMKNPFKPPRLRTRGYYIFLVTFFLSFLILIKLFLHLWQVIAYTFLIVFIIQFLYNTYLVISIIRLLMRKGTSPKLMRTILLRYVLCYLLVIPFYSIFIILYFVYDGEEHDLPLLSLERYRVAIELSILFCGFIQTMIRLCCEPYVLQTFQELWIQLY